MPTVYVLQEAPGRNLTPALKFGKLRIVLPPGDISYLSHVAYEKLFLELKDFSLEDFIILMGAPRAIAAVGHVLPAITGGPYWVLNWDRQCAQYVPSLMDPTSAHKEELQDDSTRHVSRPAEGQRGSQAGQATA